MRVTAHQEKQRTGVGRWMRLFLRVFVVGMLLLITLFSTTEQTNAMHSSQTTSRSTHAINANRPVLAFYYMWYNSASDWQLSHMPDRPPVLYRSSDTSTIDQQLSLAQQAGITGFISSWWGAGNIIDSNFAKLVSRSAALEHTTGYHFASTAYVEGDAPNLNTTAKMIAGLRYLITHYSNSNYFFHWHGKPVLFFWNPLGQGRSMATWSYIRGQVDPHYTMIWSAEGISTSLLSVFDGLHLFSAGYWGILNGNMPAVDQGFRSKIDAYNRTYHTQKIWAAGVLPGYDDTHIPGRKGAYQVPRNNGATYRTSWSAALSSNPDWVTITTFNEWFEGAMIEPSVHYGTLYIGITHQFATQWHG